MQNLDTIIQDLERYFSEVLGINIKIEAWKEEKVAPFFLKEVYFFREFVFQGKLFVFVIARNETETPGNINKHFTILQQKCPAHYVYVRRVLSAYDRKRLIERKIPFVVPGNQMYLPDFAIDLREHGRKTYDQKKIISPATQAVIIHAIVSKSGHRFIASELVKKLGYTAMTMSRALYELEIQGIGKIISKGREREFYFAKEKKALWALARPLLRNPIKNRFWIRQTSESEPLLKEFGVLSGLSALSHYSMLNLPQLPTYAIGINSWKYFQSNIAREHVMRKPSFIEDLAYSLEIWSYDPKLFAKDYVDHFSLYLSLQENPDERVQIALESMMKLISN